MEQGELLYAIAQGIISQAKGLMERQGVPMVLWPIVMENVRAHFLDVAYDHLVAVHIQEHNKTETEEK